MYIYVSIYHRYTYVSMTLGYACSQLRAVPTQSCHCCLFLMRLPTQCDPAALPSFVPGSHPPLGGWKKVWRTPQFLFYLLLEWPHAWLRATGTPPLQQPLPQQKRNRLPAFWSAAISWAVREGTSGYLHLSLQLISTVKKVSRNTCTHYMQKMCDPKMTLSPKSSSKYLPLGLKLSLRLWWTGFKCAFGPSQGKLTWR